LKFENEYIGSECWISETSIGNEVLIWGTGVFFFGFWGQTYHNFEFWNEDMGSEFWEGVM